MVDCVLFPVLGQAERARIEALKQEIGKNRRYTAEFFCRGIATIRVNNLEDEK